MFRPTRLLLIVPFKQAVPCLAFLYERKLIYEIGP